MVRRGNKPQGLLSAKLGGGEKDFDWSQLNPLNSKWLGGDRGMTPSETWQNIKSAFGGGGDDSKVRHYTQAGGDGSVGESAYQQGSMPAGAAPPGPSSDVGMPEFVSSQIQRGPSVGQSTHGLDDEAERLKAGREFSPDLASLDHQADPTLWERAKGLLSSGETGSGGGHIGHGGSSNEAEANTNEMVGNYSAYGGATDSMVGKNKVRPMESINFPQGEGDERQQRRTDNMEAMSQERRDRFQDSMPEEEGTWDKITGLFSSDDEEKKKKYKPLSKGNQAAAKMAANLLSGSDKDMPIQRAPLAGVKMGRVAFPNLLASSQRQATPRYTPKGIA